MRAPAMNATALGMTEAEIDDFLWPDYRDHVVAKSIVPTVQIIHGKTIVTSHICPPIPIRSMDWCAYFDGEEEAGGYGYGRTEAEAVADFINNLDA